MATKKAYLLPAALAASVVLCAMIWWGIESRNAILRDGKEITLKTEPVDPRDLLRGRYVRLGYDITTVEVPDCKDLLGDQSVWSQTNTKVYASLTAGPDGRHSVDRLTREKPDSGVFLAGTITGGADAIAPSTQCTVNVDYGIDRFYAAEAVAPEIERRMRDRQITDIVVAVSADGVAQIKALKQGETEIFTERLY